MGQVGIYTGRTPYGGYYTSYRIYTDMQDPCYVYTFTDHGAPTAANAAYYLTWAGGPGGQAWCGEVFYTYAIRKDSWLNAPFQYRYLDAASPIWFAVLEMKTRTGSWPSPGTRTFGHPSNQLGYGMAWYNQPLNTWGTWGSSQSNGPTQQGGSDYRYCVNVAYRAGYAWKGNTCP